MDLAMDVLRDRCLSLIESTRRSEAKIPEIFEDTLVDMAIIRLALHRLSQPMAPQETWACAQYLADMKWGDTSPQVCANTLSELGRLALIGLRSEVKMIHLDPKHKSSGDGHENR